MYLVRLRKILFQLFPLINLVSLHNATKNIDKDSLHELQLNFKIMIKAEYLNFGIHELDKD